jgi:hypothetical protein
MGKPDRCPRRCAIRSWFLSEPPHGRDRPIPDVHLTSHEPRTAHGDARQAAEPDPGGLPWPDRVVYLLTALAAGWIAFFGLFAPADIEQALSWPVPPLHAAFFGALYLSGAVLLLAAVFAGRWASVRLIVPVTGLFTGLLLVASLPHLAAFDLRTPQAQIWFGAYVVVPIAQTWLLVRRRKAIASDEGAPLPKPLVIYLWVQGTFLVSAAPVLLLHPYDGALLWPWPVQDMLAQIYGAPLFAYGVGLLLAARSGRWAQTRLLLGGLWLFAVTVLIASLGHLAPFSATDPAAWVWFAMFGGGSLCGALVLTQQLTTRRRLP